MKSPLRTWFLVTACALALPWFLLAQDDQAVPAPPPPPDQTDSQPTPYEPSGQAQAPGQDQDVSFQTFYDSLSSQGTWVQSSDYGYVWQPDVSDPDWAPYTEGHWVYSDAGWTWASTESWGWATYHYGRWANLKGRGWCWVPGYTWAPAWVSWRYGGGYCGWAPLPPDSFYGIDYFDDGSDPTADFHIGGDCDVFFGIGAGYYNFVPVTCLGYPTYHGYYSPRPNNFAIINHTTNVTNINVSRSGTPVRTAFGHVSLGGPSLAEVNAVAETPVVTVNLVASNQAGGGTVSGHALALFAPRVDPGTLTTSRPGRVAGTIGHATINRGADVNEPLVVNQQLAPAAPTTAQVQQAQAAQEQAPARAKVVTAGTVFQPVFTRPLSNFRTLAGTSTSTGAPVVFAPQAVTSRQQASPVVYPQEQVYTLGSVEREQAQPVYHQGYAPGYTPSVYSPATPVIVYRPPLQASTPPGYAPAYRPSNYSTAAPETVYRSQQSSTPPRYAPANYTTTSSNGYSSQSGVYHNGNGSQQPGH